MRGRGLADAVIDHLSWAVRPIANERQVNRARVRFDQAVRDGFVILAYDAGFECAADGALRLNAAREHHEPRGFHVEPVDDERVGKRGLYARAETVRFVGTTPWHRE